MIAEILNPTWVLLWHRMVIWGNFKAIILFVKFSLGSRDPLGPSVFALSDVPLPVHELIVTACEIL